MVTDAQSNVPLSAEEGIRRLESSGALDALKEQGYQVLTPEPAVSVVQPTVAGTTSGESASARCMLTICEHAILCVTVVSGRAGRYVCAHLSICLQYNHGQHTVQHMHILPSYRFDGDVKCTCIDSLTCYLLYCMTPTGKCCAKAYNGVMPSV